MRSGTGPASPACLAAAAREVQLLRLPRLEAFPDLVGVFRRIARLFVGFARENRRRFVRAIAAAALDVHRQEHVGPEGAKLPDEIADRFLASPLVDHFLRAERI